MSEKDDFDAVVGKMLEADGSLSAARITWRAFPASWRLFSSDRHCDVVHCLKYEGKYSIWLTTCGGNYGEHIVECMDTFMVKCGATALGGVGAPVVRDPATIDGAVEKKRTRKASSSSTP